MTTTNVRSGWFETYRGLAEEADYLRNNQMIAFGLVDAYDKLTPDDKAEIHKILGQWLVSEDNKLRYIAAFLISQRQIVDMASAVQNAIEQTDESSGPEARYELKKLKRILDELS